MGMSPRKRARISRVVQYAILALILVVIVLAADWATDQGEVLQPVTSPWRCSPRSSRPP